MAHLTVLEATAALADLDPVMGAHIDQVGPCELGSRRGNTSYFEDLARTIAFQQLAGKAAATIWGRVRALVPGRFTPEAVLALADEELRGAGLSMNKMRSMRDLAEHVEDGRLRLHRVAKLDDEEIIEELTRVRGIGRWTAEMFLMFRVGRFDVWPVGDLGVRNGYRLLYELEELPTVGELADAGDKFRPFRSLAAWYCWRAVDIVLPDAPEVPRSSG
jgi:DNA-3-methyladenine glycosylase II